jgi:hypothetical protein
VVKVDEVGDVGPGEARSDFEEKSGSVPPEGFENERGLVVGGGVVFGLHFGLYQRAVRC